MSAVFLKLVNLSIAASWLILAVILVRFLLKKAPKWISCVLWALVAIRLVCPFSLESALSLIPSSETIPSNIEMMQNPAIDTGITVINEAVNPVIAHSFTPEPMTSANPLQIAVPMLSIVWIVGMAAMLLYALISYIRLKRSVRASISVKDNILACDEVKSPFILGIIKPLIYVPSSMEGETLDYVITHETAHIRRRDHWWKPFGFLLLTVYWFNPLCWLAYILLCRDIEMACDEKVIRDLDKDSKAAYSQALLNCSFPRRKIAACPLAFGEVSVKERVKSVLNYKKPAFWIIIVAAAVCIVVAVCFLTNPKETKDAVNESMPDEVIFEAEILEIHDGYFLVAPETGWALNSADRIEVPMMNRDPSPEPQVGDIIEIACSGEILETYPGRLSKVYSIRVAAKAATATKWFDCLHGDEMIWDGRREIDLDAFPGVTFRWYSEKLEAVTEKETITLYTGMPIWSVYFCDLNGDGKPELCSTASFGSNTIDNRFIIYDYANGASYEMSDRGQFDYTLNLENGKLIVEKRGYMQEELAASGELLFRDETYQIIWENEDEPAVGDTIVFGTYEQDNDLTNGKEEIEWYILAKEEDRILVISKKALDGIPYNSDLTEVTWETCTLRSWLNDTFLNDAFSAEEQARIISTALPADINPNYPDSDYSDPGNDTTDKVFLLCYSEAEEYFLSDAARMCIPTSYAAANGVLDHSAFVKDGEAACRWWVRQPGIARNRAAYYDYGGSFNYYGRNVNTTKTGVRPAMWIGMNS